jgi:uncharacterized membrane protein
MKRTGFFFAMLAASAAALLLVVAWYLSSFQAGYGSMAGLMGQMMGNQLPQGSATAMPGYVWTSIATLLILVIVGVFGLVYYLAYPEIKVVAAQQTTAAISKPVPIGAKENWEAVLRTSKPEERKVLEVLAAHSGSHLQKLIVKESGLSRLQTHRIISRFVERGIATAVRSGNTNEISLTPWLKQDLQGVKSP